MEQIATILGIRPEDIITFNEHLVFNVMHNQNGQNGFVVNNSLPEKERKLYEGQIETLKMEINHLKSVLDKVLVK